MLIKRTNSWNCKIWWRKLKNSITGISQKRWVLAKSTRGFIDAMATSKCDKHIFDISKFLHRLKWQLLKVSALKTKSSFPNFEKSFFRVSSSTKREKILLQKMCVKNIFVCQTIYFNPIFSQNQKNIAWIHEKPFQK